MQDRHAELADFLPGRRTRLAPGVVGLRPGGRRRTPGLRREELAQLPGLSVDWYTRLEQGRDVNPSRHTLEAIAAVLRLDDDERGHLFLLASPPATGAVITPPPLDVAPEPAMARALEITTTPALVLGPRFDVLGWNAAASRLLIPFEALAPARRNMLWLTFCHAPLRALYIDLPTIEAEALAAYRFNASSHVGHPAFEALVRELGERSASFRALWARHDVRAKTGGTKAFRLDGVATAFQAKPSESKRHLRLDEQHYDLFIDARSRPGN